MRHVLLPAVAAVALAAPAAVGQDGRGAQATYWPLREISFPVPVALLQRDPKPVKLRLYAAPNGRAFEMVAERTADRLDPIENRPPGFVYRSKGDGEEEFALQLVTEDNTLVPRTEDLQPQFRIVFDTRPPVVQLAADGPYGVQWSATDENLDPAGVRLECRWAGEQQRWYPTKTRTTFRAKDGYTWAGLAREDRTLEVRVVAKDKAGHEGVSRIVKLPNTGAAGGPGRDFTDPLLSGGGVRAADPAGEYRNTRVTGDDVPGQPQIVYVNTAQITVRSKLMHVTRSGVKAVHLFVKDMTAGTGGEWKKAKVEACDIRYEAVNPQVEIPYTAVKDGRYGFIVIPESGVGRRDRDPGPTAGPQHLVEVDTIPPTVKIRNVLVSPGGTVGPRVEIEWDADDRNMMPDPIVLEYAPSKTSLAGEWKSIAEKIPNSRRYVWEVADKTLYKFFIRIRAVDKASNTGEHYYEQEVIIDLDHPSATIEHIKASSGPPERPVITPTPAAAPAPPPERTPVPSPEKPPVPGKIPDVLPPTPPGK